jgi:UDP-glucose 4-epimerase
VRAVVTGGAGFIGSHVVEALLARGDEVTVVDNLATGKRERVPEAATLVEHDIREPFDVDAEVVFHLAAQADVRVSVEDPGFDAHVNVVGTLQVLEAARRAGAQVVLASTGGAIYGECERPAREEDARLPLAPYGTAKLAAEEYLATYNRLYGTQHVALRYGNVFGPRQDPHGEAGVVAIFFGRLAEGSPLRIFGDGRQTRDYVHVADVVQATLLAAGAGGGIFNVGTGRETSVLELAGLCGRAAGVEPELVHEPARAGELQRSSLDPGLAVRELGFRAEMSLEDGLRATWLWLAGDGAKAAK